MKLLDNVKLGSKIQVKIDNEYCTTIVEGIGRDGVFYISNPWLHQKMVRFSNGQTLTMSCTTERGLLAFTVLVLETSTDGNVPIVRVVTTSEPKRIQRRMGYRASVMQEVVIREEPKPAQKKEKAAGEDEAGDGKKPGDREKNKTGEEKEAEEPLMLKTKTVNLSETGMLFLSDRPFHVGTQLRCDMVLNRFGIDALMQNVACTVRRCLPPETQADLYKVGVMFHDMTSRDRTVLAKFILYSQWNRNEGEGRA